MQAVHHPSDQECRIFIGILSAEGPDIEGRNVREKYIQDPVDR